MKVRELKEVLAGADGEAEVLAERRALHPSSLSETPDWAFDLARDDNLVSTRRGGSW